LNEGFMSMDQGSRLSQLESIHDWQGLVEELESDIAGASDPTTKAAHHLQVGKLLEGKLLQAARALKHFQDAFKLNPVLVEALTCARAVYWDLGKSNMVQKLLELELKSIHEGPEATARLIELGDVLCDAGDNERATSTYARALGTSNGTSDEARGRLEDMQVDGDSAPAHIDGLVATAEGTSDAATRAGYYLRAARLARRHLPERVEVLAMRAYEANPSDRQAATLFEGLLGQEDRLLALREMQRRWLDKAPREMRAQGAFVFGARWASKHHNHELGAELLADALAHDPSNEVAFLYLRELWGTRDGAWDKVVQLAENAVERGSRSPLIVSQAGLLAWRQLGNLMRARPSFERLVSFAPEHPSLSAFEAQIGQSLRSAPATPAPEVLAEAPAPVPEEETMVDESDLVEPAAAAAEPAPAPEPTPAPAPVAEAQPAPEPTPAPMPVALEPTPPPAAVASVPSVPPPPPPAAVAAPVAVAASPAPAAPATPVDEAKVAELVARAEKQQAARRFNEYVKTLVELAEAVGEPASKVDYFRQAAEIFTTKFSNTAEAVRCYEAILAIDGSNAEAIDFLRQSYEKRRDWEKLIGLSRRDASSLPHGSERATKFLEIARLATERVKKPEVCIELWNEVIESDPSNDEALTNLAALYERAKEWEPLASVLQKQAEATIDEQAKQALLAKLGQLYGERLKNDEAAVDAWQQLLALNPQDRRAQEALKKKYLTLGRWDDLEVFYAESGKWDEFIRLLETQEAKEKDDGPKISLLVKTPSSGSRRRASSTARRRPTRRSSASTRTTSARPRR
jgi:tetratricopeptide (TPR) repeat protein